tara:strand:- start:396 stop:920 length:525 start_codon:yes stop_codon:yes gene_type:complete
MNKFFGHSLFIAIFAILFSMLEIEIEGKDGGWAKNIPTSPSGIGIFTNYHIIMNIIIILVVSYSTLLLTENIYVIIFFIISWFVIEDFCWFVLNPYFTIDKYTNNDIWWHSNQIWIYNIPMHNILSLCVILLIMFLNEDIDLLYNFLFMIIIVIVLISISPYYHKWYLDTHYKN